MHTRFILLAAVTAASIAFTASPADARRHHAARAMVQPTPDIFGSHMIEKDGQWIYAPPGAAKPAKAPRVRSPVSRHRAKAARTVRSTKTPPKAIPAPSLASPPSIAEKTNIVAFSAPPLTSCVERKDCGYMRHSLVDPVGNIERRTVPDIIAEPILGHEIMIEKLTGGRLVSIKCGPKRIKVAASASQQFEGFCAEFYAAYKFKWVNGYRPQRCSQGSKHGCGGAADFDQTCRSRGPGHCLPKNFPVALSEKLADKYGLWPGSQWGSRDVGHFEIRGGLTSNGWKPKPEFKLASLPSEPAPKRWPVTIVPPHKPAEILDPAESTAATMPPIAFYPYSEYLPEKPAKTVLASLHGVPMLTVREEIDRAADVFGLDRQYMRAVARIESGFDPRQRTGRYAGLFQLSRYEFNAYGAGDILDARANAISTAAKLVSERVEFAHAVGREPDRGDLYLVHQQGLGGAIAHLTAPGRVAWRSMCATDEGKDKGAAWCRKAIWGNVLPELKRTWRSVERLTSGAFVAMWRSRVAEFYQGGDGREMSAKVAAVEPRTSAKRTHQHQRRYAHRIRVASNQPSHGGTDANAYLPR